HCRHQPDHRRDAGGRAGARDPADRTEPGQRVRRRARGLAAAPIRGRPVSAQPNEEDAVAARRRALVRELIENDDPRVKYYPASFSQQRLWFLCQFAPGNPFYNVESEAPLAASIPPQWLEWGIQEIVRRHE